MVVSDMMRAVKMVSLSTTTVPPPVNLFMSGMPAALALSTCTSLSRLLYVWIMMGV
jgi:hypothetical protein